MFDLKKKTHREIVLGDAISRGDALEMEIDDGKYSSI